MSPGAAPWRRSNGAATELDDGPGDGKQRKSRRERKRS